MQETTGNSRGTARTQPSQIGWTDEDNALIDRLALGRVGRDSLAAMFPGRTVGAITKRISDSRRRQGIEPPVSQPQRETAPATLDASEPGLASRDWKERHAAWGRDNERFLAALFRAFA